MITTQLALEQGLENYSPLAKACHFFLYNPGDECVFYIYFLMVRKQSEEEKYLVTIQII